MAELSEAYLRQFREVPEISGIRSEVGNALSGDLRDIMASLFSPGAHKGLGPSKCPYFSFIADKISRIIVFPWPRKSRTDVDHSTMRDRGIEEQAGVNTNFSPAGVVIPCFPPQYFRAFFSMPAASSLFLHSASIPPRGR